VSITPDQGKPIEQQLNEYIVGEFGVDMPASGLSNDDPLLDSGLIDSLRIFMLISHLEKHFGVKVEPEDVALDNFQTINTISRLIRERQAAATKAAS
jgi:acyl carrier protein